MMPRGSHDGRLRHSAPLSGGRGICGVHARRIGVQAPPMGGRSPVGTGLRCKSGSAVSYLLRRDQPHGDGRRSLYAPEARAGSR
ncbi:hypothetical protein NDU88_003472 [Pleurodeles waltl]|uniref:Uncharacterized protein n=1 Tax=Pleurodeles waltl TaxID=8319 RepID=A0AAV7LH60_PLEWA|nr:hypothetical protein NDU88_003472 [Pleurodeles waltl]